MKLYYSPGACSLSPHIVLREAGIPVELVKVDLNEKKMEDGSDFYKINPKGYVPALMLDNGELLTEGPAMVQYLADRAPEKKLAPANGTMERYRLQELLNFITSEVHQVLGSLFNPKMPPEWKAVVLEKFGKRMDIITTWLDGKTYLMGDTFTVADAYLFTVLGWVKWLKVDLSPWPKVTDYLGRVAARPAVQAALKAEGLV